MIASLRLPLIVAAVVLYAPILVLKGARDACAPAHLPAAFGLAAVACVWCFLQGVFILTQFFGVH